MVVVLYFIHIVSFKGVKYKVGKFPLSANSRAKTNNETDGLFKVVADQETDRLLGCHLIGSVRNSTCCY